MLVSIFATLFSLLFITENAVFGGPAEAFRVVEVKDSQLVIDGEKQPQLFGAELQYFRLRGGYGRNIPRERVLALWNKALDRFVEAKMNAIGFYIPWDFHEYAEGKFDFDGTADEDGDGRADYPSRDLVTFFRLVAEHGIKIIHVRPGPFINAEWGFLGFGAIPSWFHEKYPDSHMKTPWGWRRPLYDYLNPDFLRHTRIWFETLYKQVLHDKIGHGKPVVFLQIDNETNFQWQSLYSADYSPIAVARYQRFLQLSHGSLEKINKVHGKTWLDWSQIQPPQEARKNRAEDQDWYRFNDYTIYVYLGEIRRIWESIGVREPELIFTLAESYNASENGILPNYKFRNKRGVTGLMTVNLYPKTYETRNHALLNLPFKTDLDVKSATEAGNAYFGSSRQEWAMGPEIQGGWWKGTPVSEESRQQTYLTVIGHGMKSLFIYYFHEGQNWDIEWGYNKVKPLFDELRREWRAENIPVMQLPNEFWGELQARSDRLIVMGLDARRLMEVNGPTNTEDLYFDSPLDPNADPRGHFAHLKFIGERVISPYQKFLARAMEAVDEVALVKDSVSHAPVANLALDSARVQSDWSGALLGYLMNSGVNPQILHGDLSPELNFKDAKILLHLDTGLNASRTLRLLRAAFLNGQTVVNILADQTALALGIPVPTAVTKLGRVFNEPQLVTYYLTQGGRLGSGNEPGAKAVQISVTGPIFTYDMSGTKNCKGILFWQGQTVGYHCRSTKGSFVQLGAMFFEEFNSNVYSEMKDVPLRRRFLQAIMAEAKIQPNFVLSENADRTVVFGRKDPKRELLWVTVKTGARKTQSFKVQINPVFLQKALLTKGKGFVVTDLLSKLPQRSQRFSRERLTREGFSLELGPDGSGVYVVEKEK